MVVKIVNTKICSGSRGVHTSRRIIVQRILKIVVFVRFSRWTENRGKSPAVYCSNSRTKYPRKSQTRGTPIHALPIVIIAVVEEKFFFDNTIINARYVGPPRFPSFVNTLAQDSENSTSGREEKKKEIPSDVGVLWPCARRSGVAFRGISFANVHTHILCIHK